MIPNIIHHIWVGPKQFPSVFNEFVYKWKLLYPNFNFIFWNNELVESTKIVTPDIDKYYYGDYNIALKTDLLRFKILEKYGGIYIDVDTEPLRRMPSDISLYDFFSAYQPNNEIAIGIMGSIDNNSLVSSYIANVLENIPKFEGESNAVWKISGPEFFTAYLKPHLTNPKYKFYESKYFYPYAWWEMDRRNENFLDTSPDAYSVHHWTKSWLPV